MPTKQIFVEEQKRLQKSELADAHCHIDLFEDMSDIHKSILAGVRTQICDGVDTKSNLKTLERCDNTNLFPALGVDPQHSGMNDAELDFNIELIRKNAGRIVAVGEVGLDYRLATGKSMKDRQIKVFGRMLMLANELGLPVSIHSRDAFVDVFKMVDNNKIEKAHFHFFEGNEEDAKLAVSRGYMISVPPIRSSKRLHVIRSVPLSNLMTETDSPVVGKSPQDTILSAKIIAEAKGIDYEKVCEMVTHNTKAFFNVQNKLDRKAPLMRH